MNDGPTRETEGAHDVLCDAETSLRARLAAEIHAAKPTPAGVRLLVQMGGSVEWAEGYEDGLLKAADIALDTPPTPTHFGHGPECGCPTRKDAS